MRRGRVLQEAAIGRGKPGIAVAGIVLAATAVNVTTRMLTQYWGGNRAGRDRGAGGGREWPGVVADGLRNGVLNLPRCRPQGGGDRRRGSIPDTTTTVRLPQPGTATASGW
jgi:hypothetical protein